MGVRTNSEWRKPNNKQRMRTEDGSLHLPQKQKARLSDGAKSGWEDLRMWDRDLDVVGNLSVLGHGINDPVEASLRGEHVCAPELDSDYTLLSLYTGVFLLSKQVELWINYPNTPRTPGL